MSAAIQSDTLRRFRVFVVHGEHVSVYHVVDMLAPEADQPAVIQTYRNHEAAYRHAEGLNIAAGLR